MMNPLDSFAYPNHHHHHPSTAFYRPPTAALPSLDLHQQQLASSHQLITSLHHRIAE
jgi:hypothetical protein